MTAKKTATATTEASADRGALLAEYATRVIQEQLASKRKTSSYVFDAPCIIREAVIMHSWTDADKACIAELEKTLEALKPESPEELEGFSADEKAAYEDAAKAVDKFAPSGEPIGCAVELRMQDFSEGSRWGLKAKIFYFPADNPAFVPADVKKTWDDALAKGYGAYVTGQLHGKHWEFDGKRGDTIRLCPEIPTRFDVIESGQRVARCI